jgi:hypothetical protein
MVVRVDLDCLVDVADVQVISNVVVTSFIEYTIDEFPLEFPILRKIECARFKIFILK